MKRFVMLLSTVLIGQILLAQNISIDTLKGGRVALLTYSDLGNIGLEVLPTDSTPGKRLMVPEMDIPLIGAFHLSEPIGAEKSVHMNINDVKRLFFDNPEIEVIGRCSAEEVMEEQSGIPEATTLYRVRIQPRWQITDRQIFLQLCYYIRGSLYDGGVCINLFMEFDLLGELKRQFILNGTGNESVRFSQDGSMAFFDSYSISELISWTPCTDGDIILWDLRSDRQLFSYNAFDKSCFLTEQGYSADIHFTGNNLIYTFFHHKKHITDSVKYYRIIDFRNEESYIFSIPNKSVKSLKLLPNGIEFLGSKESRERHLFGSSFFHQ